MIIYPWLESTYLNILNIYQQGKGYAILISSPPGNGKASLFKVIIRWLMCSIKPKSMKYCGQCNSCQLMNTGNHPDYYYLNIKKERNSIGVDIIRMLIEKLYSHAYQDGAKLIWLAHIELLTKQGMNALLKIIEEPPDNTYFLLGCRDYACILPTLLSRCIYWQLPLPIESMGLSWLHQQNNDTYPILAARTALRLCGGAPLAAQYLLNSAYWEQRIELCSTISKVLHSGKFLTLLPLIDVNDDAPLNWLLTILVDALKLQQSSQDFLVNLDQSALINAIAKRWTTIYLHDKVQQLLYCRKKLSDIKGINRQLLLAHRLLNWELEISKYTYNNNI
ncbi:DNA polymerase III subunit delta' C-terminal domain-containing protein [Candidatus Palibaumannia cicadellinicola]|uniref:DNA polymerase III subunit delta' n=1 Tax=Candidatus Palibaumannia cicadellinicola TaxID=186490 RepID=A0A0K2BKW2_9GAMM|nr:DNA polymerase III subunit delta' C-terminal domain-containing protein [Candidatus Baumannia cicadellinicola]AKZ65970.1 DNA polymerase III delta prime subunit [Candidatus Baumannia cicadellinicola]